MTYILPILISLAALFVLFGCGGGGPSRPRSHYFFGDSITLGYGAAKGYTEIYAEMIGASFTGRIPTANPANGDISDATLDWPSAGEGRISVTRDGGGGRPLVAVSGAGLLRDYLATVRPNGPHEVLVLQCGINDAIQNAFKSETPEQFRENLAQLIALAKQDAKRVYLLAPTYVSNVVRPDVFPYLAVMRDVGQATDVKVIEPPTDPGWYGADIYHPNEAGHSAIGKAVYEALK